jgi:modulator of FtsH protease
MGPVLPAGWGEFGVAAAGATGALAGLLIVAISVNVKEIRASRVTTRGAASTIASLVLALVVALLLLIPDHALLALGIEVLAVTAPAAAVQLRSVAAALVVRRTRADGVTGGVFGLIVALAVVQYLPFAVGGVLLIAGAAAGAFVLAAGVVVVVIAAMIGAWVLLVEVLR